MKAVAARLICTLRIFKTFPINLQPWGETQAAELSGVPQGIPTCRHIGNHLVQVMSLQRPDRCTQGTKTERGQRESALGGFPKHREGSGLSEFVKSGLQIKRNQTFKARKAPASNEVVPPLGRHLV